MDTFSGSSTPPIAPPPHPQPPGLFPLTLPFQKVHPPFPPQAASQVIFSRVLPLSCREPTTLSRDISFLMIHLTFVSPGTVLPRGSRPICLAHCHNPSAQGGAVTWLLPITGRTGSGRTGSGRHHHCVSLKSEDAKDTLEPPDFRASVHHEAPGLTVKWGHMASAPNKSHSSGLINSPPIGFGAFHAVIYSPFNKFPPLSFTCSVPPFCHLMMHLACRGLSREKSKTWFRDVGVDP